MNNELKQTLKQLIEDHWALEEGVLTDKTTFEALGFDSLDATDLMFIIEEKLGIHLAESDMAEIDTFNQLVGVVERHQK